MKNYLYKKEVVYTAVMLPTNARPDMPTEQRFGTQPRK